MESPKNGPISRLKDVARQLNHSYRRMLSLAKTQWRMLALATVFLVLASGVTLAVPKFVGMMADGAAQEGLASIDRSAGWLVLLFVFQGVAVGMRFYLFTLAGQRIVCDLRDLTYRKIIEQEVGFFDQRKTGELINRLTSDTQVLQNTVTVNVSMVLRNLATALGSVVLLVYTSPKLTTLMLLMVPTVVLAWLMATRPLRRYSRDVQDALARAAEVAEETISGVRTVRAFGREAREADRYGSSVDAAFGAMRKRTRFMAVFQGAMTMASYISLAVVLWVGGRMVVDGTMSMGGLTQFILYTLILAFSLGALGSLFSDFVSAAGAAERLFALLDRKPLVALSDGRQLEGARGDICFEDVTFRYPTRPEVPALEAVSFRIQPGEVVALVGPSGSGKSTVAALLSRFYDPSSGRITLDGVPLTELDATWLRKVVGVVSQEPVLFSTSILENIGYGADAFEFKDIKLAAEAANAADFIEAFAEGYQTEVGERGVRLSGGQKQRVAIARALLKDPKILVLDEATSALDAESEHLVKQALDRLMAHRTSIVIAHRLSTVKDADRVLVVNQGRLVEVGKHEDLMARPDGVYRQLVERQFMNARQDLEENFKAAGK